VGGRQRTVGQQGFERTPMLAPPGGRGLDLDAARKLYFLGPSPDLPTLDCPIRLRCPRPPREQGAE
jgi:hypothetical protein